MITETPEPPYWAVIFTSRRTEGDAGYAAMAEAMDALARRQPGYLGIESAREGEGERNLGITVSYWRDPASIEAWKADVRHLATQRQGRDTWYRDYTVRIARVERAYTLETSVNPPRDGLMT